MAFNKRLECVACGEKDFRVVISLPFSTPSLAEEIHKELGTTEFDKELSEAPYEVCECAHCGLLFQHYIPDDRLAKRVYQNEASREISLSKKLSARANTYAREALYVEMIPIILRKNPDEIKVLEFGTGWGQFLRMVDAHGLSATGVEVIKERADFVREHGIQMSERLSELSETFDFIHTDQTLEHTNEPLVHLKELALKLNRDGIIYVAVPNASHSKNDLKKARRVNKELYPLKHLNGFSNRSLLALAKRAGLEPVGSSDLFRSLISQAHILSGGQFFQEALKMFYRQHFSTGVYFKKI
jgi:2-polyprenyl-3-methyl-5-hydroxy-6-metoxy-1,4-benzoquinol methylase